MKQLFHILIFVVIISSCAKVGSLTGGEKDEIPPVMVKAKPAENSTGIKPEKIFIEFDEFVKLDNVFTELVVSPPLDKQPKAELKGKGVQISIGDTLEDNTTYTINFGNAIKDLNEGNVLVNFTYVFSTGNYIDSMKVTGKVVDAFTLKPIQERVSLLLYENLSDTAFYTTRPRYIGQTNEEGYFSISNIKTGTYRIYGLVDNNRSLKYDAESEKIAFYEKQIHLTPDVLESTENIFAEDSVYNKLYNDTSALDSTENLKVEYAFYIKLKLFTEESKKQILLKKQRDIDKKFSLVFQKPYKNELIIEPLNFNSDSEWYIKEPSKNNDTINFWLNDTAVFKKDSLQLRIKYLAENADSIYEVIDTSYFVFRDKKNERRGKKDKEEKDVKAVKLDMAKNFGSVIDLNKPLYITLNTPVHQVNMDSLLFVTFKDDTIEVPIDISLKMDTSNIRRIILEKDWEPDKKYKLTLYPGFITDIYNTGIDTTVYNFKSQTEEYYGIVHLSLSNVSSTVVLELLDANNKAKRRYTVSSDEVITMEYLPANKYTIRAFYDDNKNGKWDTGDYSLKKQPEKVIYMPENLTVRSNWEIEHSWDLEDN